MIQKRKKNDKLKIIKFWTHKKLLFKRYHVEEISCSLGKTLVNHTSDKRLVCRIYKELLQPNNETNIKFKNRQKKHFTKENKHMANKHKKPHSTSSSHKLKPHWDNTTHPLDYNQKDWTYQVLVRMWRNWSPQQCRWGCKMVETSTGFYKKLNTEWPYDTAIPLLGTYPEELKTGVQTGTAHECWQWHYSQQPKGETTQHPSKDECIHRLWTIHIMDHSGLKRKGVLGQAATWMNFKDTWRERSQTQKVIKRVMHFIWNIPKREMHSDGKQATGCQSWGGWQGGSAEWARGFF